MEPRCETQVQEIAKNDENKKAQKRYTFPPPPSSLLPITSLILFENKLCKFYA